MPICMHKAFHNVVLHPRRLRYLVTQTVSSAERFLTYGKIAIDVLPEPGIIGECHGRGSPS